MRHTPLLLLAFLTLPGPADAQGDVPGPAMAGNASARATVRRALDAMGGLDQLAALGARRRAFAVETSDAWQGARPVARAESAPVIERGRAVWTYDPRARRAAIEESGTIFGGQPFVRRRALSPDGGFLAQDSLRRIDSLSARAAAGMLASLERQMPETLLSQVWDRRHRLQALPPAGSEARVAYAADDGTMLVLAFDGTTGLLLRQEQLADHPALGDYVNRVAYEDWRAVGGVRLPFRHIEQAASRTRVRRIRELSLTVAGEDAAPAPPAEYAGPPASPEATTELGEGVHLVPGSYNSLLVEFADFVVVVEPAVGTRAAEHVLAEAARLAPGKPVRYVIATHFHDDHLAGVRPYLAAGVTVLTTAHGAAAVREIASVRKGMYPDALDRAPRAPTVETVGDWKAITDAGQRLEILALPPSPHAEQMLVVWLPAAGVLYEADVLDIDVPEGGSPMPGDDTRQFGAWLARSALPVRTIVPTHGRVGTPEDLRRALAR